MKINRKGLGWIPLHEFQALRRIEAMELVETEVGLTDKITWLEQLTIMVTEGMEG